MDRDVSALKTSRMKLEITSAEFEMIENSVELRLDSWRQTVQYLRTGDCEGITVECHKLTEAEWVAEQYEDLLQRLWKQANP